MNNPSFDLSNKVALITGASRGIGLAIAETLAKAGASVVLSSRNQEALNLAAEKISSAKCSAVGIAAHTGDPEAIKHLIDQTLATYGGLDILVNNAGTNPHFGPILTAEDSQWDKIMEVNLKGYYRVTKACVESMRQRGGGKIINIASIMGMQAYPAMGIYCISKAGVIMLTQVLAIELAPDNIQVNALAPGLIKTKFSRLLWETPQLNQAIINQIPQKRLGDPEDLTGLALYLASPASNFTTGAVFVVDGGQLAGSSFT